MLTGSWFVRYCLWLWNENRTKQENNTVCISVFVPLCARVCVYFLAGSPLGQMERVFCLPSLSQCLFLSCSFSFLSNHSFPLAVNRQVGKSICTHTHTLLAIAAGFMQHFSTSHAHIMWRQSMDTLKTHTLVESAHHTLGLLLTHDQSKTHTHTDSNHIESTERSRSPTASSFYYPLNWNYTHTHRFCTGNWDFERKKRG